MNDEFKYKAIDFDSCFSWCQTGSSFEIPSNTKVGELETLVTPRYIAPERAEILLRRKGLGGTKGKLPALDSKQDVFIFGLILFRLFTRSEYFSSEQIASGEYEKILADRRFRPSFPKDLHKGVRTVLEEMLRRDPKDRPSFEQVLRHSVWNSESSVRMSIIVNKITAVETAILERIEVRFGRMEVQMDQLGNKMDSVF